MVAFFVGLGMGLVFAVLGAGGGIIAVPVLLVLFKLPMSAATGGGLAVVFAAAVTAAAGHARARRVDWRVALLFGPPSMLGAVVGAQLNPLVPERITSALFAAVLLVATASLFRKKNENPAAAPKLALIAVGLGLGVMTGFLGVGGGFLVVPALVSLAGVPLQRAVGTSAVVIAVSSFSGALTTLVRSPELVPLLLPIGAGAALGALLGVGLAGKLPPKPLRAAFAVLAVVVAGGMAWRAF